MKSMNLTTEKQIPKTYLLHSGDFQYMVTDPPAFVRFQTQSYMVRAQTQQECTYDFGEQRSWGFI